MPEQHDSWTGCRWSGYRRACAVMTVWAMAVPGVSAAADRLAEGFAGREVTSRITVSSSTAEVTLHRRESQGGVDGSGCERVIVRTRRLGTSVTWEQSIPAARVIDELAVSVSTWSRSRGLQLAVRVVFPHQVDPRTGRVLTDLLPGPRVTQTGQWQKLTLEGIPGRLRERLVLLRARLKRPGLKGRDAYIDRVVLQAEPDPGTTEWLVDDLRMGPIVAPGKVVDETDERETNGRSVTPAEVRLDRLHVEGRPFLPRVIVYRGEPLEVLKASGANLVQVPDYRDRGLIERLRSAGLWAMAAPPRPPTVDGVVADPGTAALVPIATEADGVLCWYLDPGATVAQSNEPRRIGRLEWNSLTRWVNQLRIADRRMKRPIVADVEGLEHVISRQRLLPLISREVIGTGLSLKLHQEWLDERRDRARPGSLAWSWIRAESKSLVVEPEQIELQVRSALAAGFRGLGYRTTERLDADRPVAGERLLMLGLLNLELELLESFLATSTRVGRLPVTVGRRIDPNDPSAGTTTANESLDVSNDRIRRRRRVVATNPLETVRLDGPRVSRKVESVLFRTDYGRLLMINWVGENVQFVPDQMALANVSVVVPGGDETATAWELTTTGLRSLATRRVAGGVVLELNRFDRRSNIILTSNPALVSQLRRQVATISGRAARMALQLAQARFDRVRNIDRRLVELGHPQPDAPRLVARAASYLSQAAAALDQGEANTSRLYSDATLQTLRILQRAHWEQAIRESASPVASTLSRCFQTLPQHWELVAAVRSAGAASDPRLVGGDFENLEEMVRAGWSSRRAAIAGMTMVAEVYRGSRGRNGEAGSCLRLSAQTDLRTAVPSRLPRHTVIVDSPLVPVKSGELVRISGRIRLVSARPGSLDGGVLEDTLGGPDARLHCRRPGGWRRFELLRKAQRDTDVQLRVALEGMGELRVDDLQIEVLSNGLAAPDRLPTVESETGTVRPAALRNSRGNR
ncbi:MAG: hypothetical protein VYA32_07485 [Planctomycetota bacterium]|nr:hypothetical protein [Planctomycetota bacterium]